MKKLIYLLMVLLCLSLVSAASFDYTENDIAPAVINTLTVFGIVLLSLIPLVVIIFVFYHLRKLAKE
jgi:hypothetical protein